MKRMTAGILGALLTVGLLAGCSSKPTTAHPVETTQPIKPDQQTLTLNLGAEPPSLDSAIATDEVSFAVLNAINEGLIRLAKGGDIQKGTGAAADWSISEDGLTYTFTLKDGLTWSDNQPLTARDFVYAWLRALDPKVASQYNYQLFYIKGAEEWSSLNLNAPDFAAKYDELKRKVAIAAPDAKTIRVTLKNRTPYFLGLMAFPTYFPQRQDLIEQQGEKYAVDADKLVFNGPFLLRSWQHQAEIVLGRNPAYWDAARVQLTTINFKMISDSNTQINMFEAGQMDQTGVPGAYIPQYKDKPGFVSRPTSTTWYLAFNLDNAKTKGYLQNRHIRRAFDYALDRGSFVENILRNGSEPAQGLVPSSIHINGASYRKVAGEMLSAKPEPALAQKELAQGLKELGLDKLPRLDFLIDTGDQAKKFAQGVQGMVQQALPGVVIDIVPLDFKVRLDRQRKGDFDLTFSGWGADYDDPNTFLDLWVTDGQYNDPKWSNKEYDGLIKQAAAAVPEQRAALFAKAEKILLDELPILPIYHPAANGIWKPYVKGVLTFSVGAGLDLKGAYIEGKSS